MTFIFSYYNQHIYSSLPVLFHFGFLTSPPYSPMKFVLHSLHVASVVNLAALGSP